MSEARLLAFDDPKRARELIQLGLERAPDRPNVHQQRAYVALARGDFEEALAAAQRAVELDPESSARWSQLGKVHQARILKHQLARRRPPRPSCIQAALDAFARGRRRREGRCARAERGRARARGLVGTPRAGARGASRRDRDRETGLGRGGAGLRRQGLRRLCAEASATTPCGASPCARWSRRTRTTTRPGSDLAILSDGQPVPRGEEVCRELIAKRAGRSAQPPVVCELPAAQAAAGRTPSRICSARSRARPPPRILWGQLIDLQLRNNQIAATRATASTRCPMTSPTIRSRGQPRLGIALAEGRDRRSRRDPAQAGAEQRERGEPAHARRRGASTRRPARRHRRDRAGHRARPELPRALPDQGEHRLRREATGASCCSPTACSRAAASASRRATTCAARTLSTSSAIPTPARAVLEQVLAQPNAPADAAIEFARREGAARFDTAHAALLAAQDAARRGIRG